MPDPTQFTPFDADFEARDDDPLLADDLLDESLLDDPLPLATPWIRLGAFLLDMLFYVIALTPGMIAATIGEEGGSEGLTALGGFLLLIAVGGLFVYNLVLLSNEGQTVAKRLLKLRIVDANDGSNPGFARAVLLRSFVPGLIGAVPLVGAVFSLVDPLFIFSEEHQTIHDRFATTVVVRDSVAAF